MKHINDTIHILNLLKHAVQQTYEQDSMLITQESPTERPVVHKIATYLEQLMPQSDFNIDVDYNRNMGKSKYLDNISGNAIIDILVHIRNSNSNNMLAIEVKMYDENETRDTSKLNKILKDKNKLLGLTSDEDQYKFRLGVFIRMNHNGPRYTYFQHGRELQNETEIQ